MSDIWNPKLIYASCSLLPHVFGQIHLQLKWWILFFVLTISFIRENPSLNADSVEPDQTPFSAASNLCLFCLPISL